MADVRVDIVDGSHHEGDSSHVALRRAAALAFHEAATAAAPVLLEPVMRGEVPDS